MYTDDERREMIKEAMGYGLPINEAKRVVARNELIEDIIAAESIDDLKKILLFIVNKEQKG